MRVTRVFAIVLATMCVAGCGERGELTSEVTEGPPTEWNRRPTQAPLFLPEGVAVADPPPPPIQGGSLLATTTGFAVVADQDRDAIFVVSLDSDAVTATLALEPGDQPGRMVEGDRGFVHVVLRGGGAVVTLDPATGELLSQQRVCSTPSGIDYDDGMLHLVCETGELYSWQPRESAPLPLRNLGRDLRDVVAYEGELFVTRFRSAEVIRIAADGTATQHFAGGAASPEDRQPHVAWRMRGVPGGGVHVLHQLHRPVGEVTNPSGMGYENTGCDGDVVVALSRVDTEAPPRVLPSVGTFVPDFDVSAGGAELAIVATGQAFDPFELLADWVLFDMHGDDCGPSTYRHSWPDTYEVVSIAYDAFGALLLQSREPAVLLRRTSNGTTMIELSDVSRKDTGLAYFHADSGRGLACVTCHPLGRDDGHVWRFEEGLRRTQTLAGTLVGTAPYHWDGAMEDLGDIMTSVFNERMRGAKLDKHGHEAFVSWLLSIAPPRGKSESDASHAGRLVFEEKGCADCHGGAALTDNSTQDVATGGAFQVPSLVGVGARFPYMHDGCASTLENRFTVPACGGAQHGDVVGGVELFELIQYLETL